MADATMLRAFAALEVGADLRAALVELLAGPVAGFRGLRRVRPEGLHLTLRFFGATRADQVEDLAAALAPAVAACPAAAAAATGLGVFPGRGAPRVLWVGLDLPEPVRTLQAACERAARAAGFAPERRPFAPHVTLGRWREHAPSPRLPVVSLPPARLSELVLFRSDLEPGGARYTALRRLPLGGTPPRGPAGPRYTPAAP
ncbi:MAG: RNA 2',3'-cyclic phosphodiesterase [Vicinamibacteria bacterium]|nr:RNA 2',3'-cyclic phosphodiesterase [Vicinamibacteria bacterium]